MIEHTPTNARMIQRVSNNINANYGFVHTDNISYQAPAIVAFGGELTIDERGANSYAKMLDCLLKENGISGVNVYSVIYDFEPLDAELERARVFIESGCNPDVVLISESVNDFHRVNTQEPFPNYVRVLYEKILRPRVSDKNGQRLALHTATERMRRVKFYAHCHGAAVIYQMGNHMFQDMHRLKYSDDEIKSVMSNLLVIQHNPLTPLENLKFTTVSFGSASDTKTDLYTEFSDYIHDNPCDIVPSFFPRHGNMFVAGQLKNVLGGEHSHVGLLSEHMTNPCFLTDDGRIIFSAERNTLVRGAKHSLRGGKLPSVKKLVNGDGVDFQTLKENGAILNKFMKQNPKRANQR